MKEAGIRSLVEIREKAVAITSEKNQHTHCENAQMQPSGV
jgi:hypothetical protein